MGYDLFSRTGFDPANKQLIVLLPLIEQFVALIPTIQNAGPVFRENLRDKRPLSSIAIGEVDFHSD